MQQHPACIMKADLQCLTISSELKALVGVIRTGIGGCLTLSSFYYRVTVLDRRKGRASQLCNHMQHVSDNVKQ